MTDTSDLVIRLRDINASKVVAVSAAAADRLEELEAECARLRDAGANEFRRFEAMHEDCQNLKAENQRLREALADIVSWFPEKPAPPEWRIKSGEYGADDAVKAARTALKGEET
jgi:hypothetical protein